MTSIPERTYFLLIEDDVKLKSNDLSKQTNKQTNKTIMLLQEGFHSILLMPKHCHQIADVCKMHPECLKGPFTLIWWSWFHHLISQEDIAFHENTVCSIGLDNGGHQHSNTGCRFFKEGGWKIGKMMMNRLLFSEGSLNEEVSKSTLIWH